jgi:hypothetical protein
MMEIFKIAILWFFILVIYMLVLNAILIKCQEWNDTEDIN